MDNKQPQQFEERVLLLAPTARDAATSCGVLEAAGVRCFICNLLEDVCREAGHGAGAAVVTAETIVYDKSGCLARWLQTQPPWSDFPLIVLTPPGAESPKLLRALAGIGHMTLMQRPVQVSTLVSTIRAALRDRQRQYAVRTLLDQLRDERERYRVTLASIGDAVIATDTDGRVTFHNQVAEQLTGWDAAAAQGRPLDEVFRIVNETTRVPVENPTTRALREGSIVGLANHTILIAHNGTERPVDDSAAPIRGERGNVVGAVLVFRDVTEKRRAEAALRESEGLLRLATDAADLGIWVWDAAADRVTWENDRPYKMFGLDETGEPINAARFRDEFVHPDDFGAFERAMVEASQPGGRLYFLGRFRRADGEIRWVEFNGGPMGGDDGTPLRMHGTAADVTERKRAEEQVRQVALANAKFRTMFEQGSQFAGILALDGAVVEANRLCLTACGFTRQEVIGRPFWECGWWNRSPELMKMVKEAALGAAAGRAFRTESPYFTADGSECYVDLIIAPVADDDGQVLFVAATGTDITERKKADAALQEADRRKDDFIALLAHELRNPLAPLRNGLQVMRLAAGDAGSVAQARAMMKRQLGHMVRLIDDLLDISRISRNKMELRRTRVLLADVIDNAVETARPALEAAGHELSVKLPAVPIYLDADMTRLAQVFSNLLSNSAKYTERGGRVWISAECANGMAIVSIRDNGIGIPTDALPHIFDMFSQVDRSIERSTGGLGIGLALVKGLVEMHGGTVAATSAGPNMGSAFTVRLPVLESSTEPLQVLADDEAPAIRGPRRRMLVVDDNRDSAASMAMMLEMLGNEVATAHDGIEAVATAEDFRPEVILMDVGMPRLNGLDATRRIRELRWGRNVVIIALTGWGQDGDRALSREAGCDGHLVKPVNLLDLEKLLAELTGSVLHV